MTGPSPRARHARFALLLPFLGTAAPSAQSEEMDLVDLSIEDLLAIQMPSMQAVLGGHVHNEGEWMPMVHVMAMQMDGLRDGTRSLSTTEILQDFMVAPTEMETTRVLAGVMYGWSDRMTLSAMVPYVSKSMTHATAMGGFTTDAEGVGDLQLATLYALWEDYEANLVTELGLHVPTGSTDERDATPMGSSQKLPYPMQLGSGTWDVAAGLTYTRAGESVGWGASARSLLRLGANDEDYSLGDRLEASTWAQYELSDSVAATLRLKGLRWGSIDGADSELMPATVPTANAAFSGGTRVDVAAGIELYSGGGTLAGHSFHLEFGVPVYESLTGPQMSTESWVMLGWSVTR